MFYHAAAIFYAVTGYLMGLYGLFFTVLMIFPKVAVLYLVV